MLSLKDAKGKGAGDQGWWWCLPEVKGKVNSGRKERQETKDWNMNQILKQGRKQPCWIEFVCFSAFNISPQGPTRTDLHNGRAVTGNTQMQVTPMFLGLLMDSKELQIYLCILSCKGLKTYLHSHVWAEPRSGRIQPLFCCCPMALILRVCIIDNMQTLALMETCKLPWLSGSAHESSMNGYTTANSVSCTPYPLRV